MAKTGTAGAVTVRIRADATELNEQLSKARSSVTKWAARIGAVGGAITVFNRVREGVAKLNDDLETQRAKLNELADATDSFSILERAFVDFRMQYAQAFEPTMDKIISKFKEGAAAAIDFATAAAGQARIGFQVGAGEGVGGGGGNLPRSMRELQERRITEANQLAAQGFDRQQVDAIIEDARRELAILDARERIEGSWEERRGTWWRRAAGGALRNIVGGSRLGALIQSAPDMARFGLAQGREAILGRADPDFERERFRAPRQLFSGAAAGTAARSRLLEQRRQIDEIERMRREHEEEQDRKEEQHAKKAEEQRNTQANWLQQISNGITNLERNIRTTDIW